MIGSALKNTEKPSVFMLLVIFGTISLLSLFNESLGLIQNPISLMSVFIPLIVILVYIFLWWWLGLIRRLNDKLPNNDFACFGTLIGCSILTYCVLITFFIIGDNPEILNFNLLIKPSFFQLITLYLFGLSTLKVKRINFE
ncbi:MULTISPECIES: hypothetical protein [unclassified Pseudoalteromonas]|uniref:hypothetical protein n=1 Tax=unclassified Pseudoalteromonas TaxID=194690 RepID=UPI0025B2B0B6|nr:hypothetical protein [Pseudoalteromonas sp. APC 3250]MDC2854661.1 hypothetical protein [Ningiella sp. W23]MDN3414542.1 hypothetical protein [Pseudoalteromonas sp. APC 3250]